MTRGVRPKEKRKREESFQISQKDDIHYSVVDVVNAWQVKAAAQLKRYHAKFGCFGLEVVSRSSGTHPS